MCIIGPGTVQTCVVQGSTVADCEENGGKCIVPNSVEVTIQEEERWSERWVFSSDSGSAEV